MRESLLLHREIWTEFPTRWPGSDAVLAVVDIWGANQRLGIVCLSVSLSFFLSPLKVGKMNPK